MSEPSALFPLAILVTVGNNWLLPRVYAQRSKVIGLFICHCHCWHKNRQILISSSGKCYQNNILMSKTKKKKQASPTPTMVITNALSTAHAVCGGYVL